MKGGKREVKKRRERKYWYLCSCGKTQTMGLEASGTQRKEIQCLI